MSTTTLTVRISPDISSRLAKLAEATKRSKSFLAAEAIEEYVTLQEWQVSAILAGADEADREEGVDLGDLKRHWEKRHADSLDQERG